MKFNKEIVLLYRVGEAQSLLGEVATNYIMRDQLPSMMFRCKESLRRLKDKIDEVEKILSEDATEGGDKDAK
jgi:hypothetical protein